MPLFAGMNRRGRLDILIGNEPARAFWRAIGFADYCVPMERES